MPPSCRNTKVISVTSRFWSY